LGDHKRIRPVKIFYLKTLWDVVIPVNRSERV